MKFISILLCLLAFTAALRLDFNHQNCTLDLQKLGVTNNPEETTLSKNFFTGDAYVVEDNLKVYIRYPNAYFISSDYFGLVQEDGRTAQTTCLDLKLLQFTSNSYCNPVQITDLPVRGHPYISWFSFTIWSSYSFSIPVQHIRRRLIKTAFCGQSIYKGYYAIAFYAAGTVKPFLHSILKSQLLRYSVFLSIGLKPYSNHQLKRLQHIALLVLVAMKKLILFQTSAQI
ncbi:unnamed protein product [Paramecium octaurelia]|uniref:Uncharacterized protein n=1 Tax=Paramecium octaurelia TaxID=43137 RepID=A0A8S1WEX4_PAROT|nr:unnamed protein product [Paramecium octaurelia]